MRDLAKHVGPKVVLASNVSLETGFTRELFLEWAGHSDNALVLTDRGPPQSLARRLYEAWDHASDEAIANNKVKGENKSAQDNMMITDEKQQQHQPALPEKQIGAGVKPSAQLNLDLNLSVSGSSCICFGVFVPTPLPL
jgi:hypothetical protein